MSRESENTRLREYNSRPEVKKRRAVMSKEYRSIHGAELRANNKIYRDEQRRRKPWQKLLQCARQRAKQRGLEFSLTPEWALQHYTGYCAVTGLQFSVGLGKSGPQAFSPSIDRIDQGRGYSRDNCRFVIFAVNAIRGTMSDADMVVVAERIVASLREAS